MDDRTAQGIRMLEEKMARHAAGPPRLVPPKPPARRFPNWTAFALVLLVVAVSLSGAGGLFLLACSGDDLAAARVIADPTATPSLTPTADATLAPEASPTPSPAPVATLAPTASPTPEPTLAPTPTTVTLRTYKVLSGDTIYSVCKKFYGKYNTTLKQSILDANKAKYPAILKGYVNPGWIVTIP